MKPNENRTDVVVQKLIKSPVFNMSLSSKELFHSNFIGWLIVEYREQMSSLFSSLLGEEIAIKLCEREKKNFDLFIHCSGERDIIIENKFKSIVQKEQLRQYNKKVESPETYRILLSLHNTLYEEEVVKNAGWILIGYDDYVRELKKIRVNDSYQQFLINDYCQFVEIIIEEFSKTDFGSITVNQMIHESNRWEEIRLHDMYQKHIFSYLCWELNRKMKSKLGSIAGVEDVLSKTEAWQGFTRATGLVVMNYVVNAKGNNRREGVRLELQLQYRSLKLMLIHSGKDPRGISKNIRDTYFAIIEKVATQEFCEADKGGACVVYPKGDKDYNQYGNNLIYRNIKLSGDLKMKEIVDLMIKVFAEVVLFGEKYKNNDEFNLT